MKRQEHLFPSSSLGIDTRTVYLQFSISFPTRTLGTRLKYHKDMNPDNPGGEMLESLTDDYLKQGMSKLEVIKLLGIPDIKNEENTIKCSEMISENGIINSIAG